MTDQNPTTGQDETEHLLSSPRNAERLMLSVQQIKENRSQTTEGWEDAAAAALRRREREMGRGETTEVPTCILIKMRRLLERTLGGNEDAPWFEDVLTAMDELDGVLRLG